MPQLHISHSVSLYNFKRQKTDSLWRKPTVYSCELWNTGKVLLALFEYLASRLYFRLEKLIALSSRLRSWMCTWAYCFFVVCSGTFRFMFSVEFYIIDIMMRKIGKQTSFIGHDSWQLLTDSEKVSTQLWRVSGQPSFSKKYTFVHEGSKWRKMYL